MTTETEVFDPVAWERAKTERLQAIFEAEGLLGDDDKLLRPKLREKCSEIIRAEAHCETAEDRKSKPLTKPYLTAMVLPSADLEPKAEDHLGIAVAEIAKQAVWGEINTRDTSPLQREIGKHDGEHGRLGLVKAKPALDEVCYVTSNEALIFTDLVQPERDKLNRQAEKLSKTLSMVAQRMPALSKRATKTLTDSMADATVNAKNALALTQGEAEASDS